MASEQQLIRAIEGYAQAIVDAVAEAEAWGRRSLQEIDEALRHQLEDIRSASARRLAEVHEVHKQALQRVQHELAAIEETAGLAATAWSDPRWQAYAPPRSAPEVMRIGKLTVSGSFSSIETPALLPFAGGGNLVIRAAGAAKDLAIRALQALTLRFLVLVPPSSLRLLLIDPVGIGQNVALFMNLKDRNPNLVTGQAWAEKKDIEKQLADLSAHMGMVIQTYLRGHYRTMEEYNAEAGKVAEAYRLVVVLDFPANFSEEAAKRLVSVATNGPQCGVFTAVMVDTGQTMPRGFQLSDLERVSTVIEHDGSRFVWRDPDFSTAQLDLDTPPTLDEFERLIGRVDTAASEAANIELPFDELIPSPEAWWNADSLSSLQAPIGQAGAKKIQVFKLGQGTAHHGLVAGQTGSGKSNLLHVLITSLALKYPPDEVELYLVDFKKGVEFKDYATLRLPHARVVSIESEREFGLSVLQALDGELERRGRLFRAAGEATMTDYRRRTGLRLPRVLLIVDEFQEFFTEDDDIRRQAIVLLDRLARQGRAFGVHLLLGSQTLAGTYSLSRTTIDQMAVRIALRCSAADSEFILSKDNPAARLLTRPGEAFYNEMSGMKEGNVPFQVAWLDADRRADYLRQVAVLAGNSDGSPRRPIVFEGGAPAQIENAEDHPLRLLARESTWREDPRGALVWLGEPVTIKDPTAARLTRRRGRNVTIVGRNEELAVGMILTMVVSLAAQYAPASARFCIVDFMADNLERERGLAALKESLPHNIDIVPPRRLIDTLTDIGNVVTARVKEEEPSGPSLFLVLIGLHRARALRRSDEVTYARKSEARAMNPPDLFAAILSDGPEVGVHTVAWAEQYPALMQVLDRKALAEFGIRVVMAMADKDSYDLVNSPAAAKLGPYRALLFDEDNPGSLEKFRPYQYPTRGWINDVGERLRAKH